MSVDASFSRAVSTQQGGYVSKQLSAALQNVVADDEGSDCGSKNYITIELTNGNIDDYKYRYIIDKNKLICLTPEVIQTYIGKKVKMRTPMYCKNKKYCSKCIGEFYYKIGIKNIGLTTNKIGGTLLNLSLKQMHSNTISSKMIDVEDFII